MEEVAQAGSSLTYTNQSLMTPLAGGVLCVGLLAVFVLSRRDFWIPIVIVPLLIPFSQRIAILGIDFTLMRILLIASAIRIASSGWYRGDSFSRIDRAVLLWLGLSSAVYILREASVGALVYKAGYFLDAALSLVLFRSVFVRNTDVSRMLVVMSLVGAVLAGAFVLEVSTGRNLFSYFGGVPEFTKIREGRLRAQGAFSHPIIAGVFWAAVMVLLIAEGVRGSSNRGIVLIGVVSSLTIIGCCASSTPVFMLAAGVFGLLLWWIRTAMIRFVWACVGCLFALHLVMEAPVWHLLARVSAVGGSTGYHRYHLIDQFVSRPEEWFLLGVSSTAHWGWGLQDVTNQFVLEGVRGGALGLSLFVYVLYLLFGSTQSDVRARDDFILWSRKALLFSHCAAFLSVSCFGQAWIVFWLSIAIVQAGTRSASLVESSRNVPSSSQRAGFRYV